MSFIVVNFPVVILSYVKSFLDNKSSINLMITCKEMSQYGKNTAFLTSIRLDYKENYSKFIQRYSQHKNTIKKIEVNGMENPHLWLPNYVNTVMFLHCSIYEYVDPGPSALFTKVLILRDYNRHKNQYLLCINWDWFVNLEILELYVYDVDIKGIDKLTKLREKKIDTIMSKKRKYII